MQSFFRRDAREKSNREWTIAIRLAQVEALRVDPQRHHTNLLSRNTEIARHEARVILAHGKKHIDVIDLVANEIERLRAIWFLQAVQKKIFTLKRANDRHIERLFERRQPD